MNELSRDLVSRNISTKYDHDPQKCSNGLSRFVKIINFLAKESFDESPMIEVGRDLVLRNTITKFDRDPWRIALDRAITGIAS